MLYDPKWEVQTKPDVFSLERLIAWLEMQPAERTYDYCKSDQCLIAEYLKAHGVAAFDLPDLGHYNRDFWRVANDGRPIDTYGAALDRARGLVRR